MSGSLCAHEPSVTESKNGSSLIMEGAALQMSHFCPPETVMGSSHGLKTFTFICKFEQS